jgi:hypothetical protein
MHRLMSDLHQEHKEPSFVVVSTRLDEPSNFIVFMSTNIPSDLMQ